MKHLIPGPLPEHARSLMRRVGYAEHQGYGGQISYVRRLSGDQYPRYHAYVEDVQGGMMINLHLDQKKASYESGAAHGGEYDGPLVNREMQRILEVIHRLSVPPSPKKETPPAKKSGWLRRFF